MVPRKGVISLSIGAAILIFAYTIQIISLLAVIFTEDKNPISTLSWIMVLTFLPIVGVVFYIFFGRGLRGFTKKRYSLVTKLAERFSTMFPGALEIREYADKIANDEPVVLEDPKMQNYLPIMKQIMNLNHSPYTQENDMEIFIDGREKYDALFEDIRNAKHHVHMVYFIISNTDISHQLIDLLTEKAKEGVEVRVIYDEIGNFVVPSRMFNKISKAGGEVLKFFPLNFKNILHANYRNHHKIVVIDGEIGYTGGMNIGDEYMGLREKNSPWRDTHMRLTGQIVSSLQNLFILDYYYILSDLAKAKRLVTRDYFPKPIDTGSRIGMQIVNSGPDEDMQAVKRVLISMIATAKKSVYVQTPYLMPDQPLQEALQSAAISGVEVIVMLPGVADKNIPYHVTYYYIQSLLDYGVKIFLHKGFLHAKTMVVDDTIATIGTTNFDFRSLALHFELNNIIFDSKVAKQCSDIFTEDLKDCTEMTQEIYDSRGGFKKFKEKILRLFAPLL